MRRAVVVRTKKTELRADGRYVKSVLLSNTSSVLRLIEDLTTQLVYCSTQREI
jgi:ribosomal protein L14